MSQLAGWLSACQEEDERRITGCCHCGNPIREISSWRWTHDGPGAWQGIRCPRRITGALPNPEPDQARREVAFKRTLLTADLPEWVLAELARVYEGRPGYAEATGDHRER